MKVEQFRDVLEKFAALHDAGRQTQKSDSLRVLAKNLEPFDAKTVKTFVKQHHQKATRAKSTAK